MIKTINNTRIKFLGDVHIGKVFKNGVPLDRRGDREQMVRDQFDRELNSDEFDILIQNGDLFDVVRPDFNDVMFVVNAITRAAESRPGANFYFVAGNHDLGKIVNKVSGFHLAAALCSKLKNVDFVIDTALHVKDRGVDFVLFPWSNVHTAEQVATSYPYKTDFVVGHWDHVAISDTSNLIPLSTLSKITDLAVSGHDHIGRSYKYSNMEVIITGSMQPYSFGEDPDGRMYVTKTLEEVTGTIEQYHNLNLRILLNDGESAPVVDCLCLQVKKVRSEEDNNIEVGFEEGLDLRRLFKEQMSLVSPSIASEVEVKFEECVNA